MLKNARKPHKKNNKTILLVETLCKKPAKYYIKREVKHGDNNRI